MTSSLGPSLIRVDLFPTPFVGAKRHFVFADLKISILFGRGLDPTSPNAVDCGDQDKVTSSITDYAVEPNIYERSTDSVVLIYST